MANKSNFKGMERKIATLLGTYRTPLSGGSSRITRSDTLSADLYVEAKKRKNFAIIKLFEDTLEKANLEKKLPVVVIQETGSQKRYWMVEEGFLLELARYIQLKDKEEQDGKRESEPNTPSK